MENQIFGDIMERAKNEQAQLRASILKKIAQLEDLTSHQENGKSIEGLETLEAKTNALFEVDTKLKNLVEREFLAQLESAQTFRQSIMTSIDSIKENLSRNGKLGAVEQNNVEEGDIPDFTKSLQEYAMSKAETIMQECLFASQSWIKVIQNIKKNIPENGDENCNEIPADDKNGMPGLHDRRYNMKHTRRGKVVIFNHQKFNDGSEYREGSEADVRSLEKSLPRLGFQDITVHQDLTYDQITNELRKLSTADHGEDDCLMVFVLSHGGQNDTLVAYDKGYSTTKIWEPFLGDKCETLRGKPKIFFFVACRGGQTDAGVKLEQQKIRSRTSTDSKPFTMKNVSYTIPIHADVLTVHSTQPLHFSFRDFEKGTFYVHAFCHLIDKLPAGVSFNFVDFLTQVNLKVGATYESQDIIREHLNKKRQCPSYTSTLTRLIYITPENI